MDVANKPQKSLFANPVGFVPKSGIFKEHEIVALVYNSDAATGLKQRLAEKLSGKLGRNVAVASKTFHAFGLSVLVQVQARGINHVSLRRIKARKDVE